MGTSGDQAGDYEASGSQRVPALILSPREKALLRRLAEGKPDKQIAQQIGGTERQIAAQRQRLIDRLGISPPTELAIAAERLARFGILWPRKPKPSDRS
jgi:DNA-binding NarL/FixJ family response regulator